MAMATSLSTLNLHPSLKNHNPKYFGLGPVTLLKNLRNRYHIDRLAVTSFNGLIIRAATEGSAKSSQSDEKIPSWARPDSDEPPPWAEGSGNGSSSQSTFEIPFYAYLLASAITAIAAVNFRIVYNFILNPSQVYNIHRKPPFVMIVMKLTWTQEIVIIRDDNYVY